MGRGSLLVSVFSSWIYPVIALAGAIAYFALFAYMIKLSNYGIFIVTVPIYLVYAMVLTAGILLALGVYSVRMALLRPAAGAEEGALSVILPTVGGLVATCACNYSLFGLLLVSIGISSLEVSGIMAAVAAYQLWILSAIIVINLLLIYYYSGRLADAACRVPRGRRRS